MPEQQPNPVTIKLPAHLSTGEAENLRAYVVNSNGTIIDTAHFRGHTAQLAHSSQALRSTRLFIGPGFPADYPAHKIDVYALAQAGAYQVSASPGVNNEISIQRLPPNIIVHPPLHFCEVQGNVRNTLTINGVSQSGPVCKARVHICTVEWYFRWPIWLRPVIPVEVVNQLQGLILARRAKPKAVTSAAPKRLPVTIEDQILSATTETIHDIVSTHSALLHPYLCYYPIFWPWFYRVTEQEVVFTDCNGHFDGWLVSLGTVQENIYIWVEANINGSWVTVYKPPFPCHTLWNYACGTEIDISLANAAIPPCNCDTNVVDGTVWFTAIGGYGIAKNIQQDVTSVYAPAGIKNVGCTNLTDANQLAPFGSTLNLWLASGPTLPATHYRWSWTPIIDSAGNPVIGGTPTQITGVVSRPYLWPVTNGWEAGSIPLQDTDADSNIAYFLPNYDVTSYPGVSPLAEWVSFNFLSAAFDSTKIPNGSVIRFDLELLKVNASGVFEAVSVPVSTFQVSNDTNAAAGYDGSSAAPYTPAGTGNNYLTLDPAISGNALSFSLKVRVDNSPVTATINDAYLSDASGNPIPGGNSGPCGFITFTSASQDVDISFVASEPFHFATFNFNVVKGNSGTILATPGSSYVFAPSVSFTLNGDSYAFTQSAGGTFTATPSVTDLLSGCPQAAFGESLSVSSLATDGSGLLAETIGAPYYASAAAAFALSPG